MSDTPTPAATPAPAQQPQLSQDIVNAINIGKRFMDAEKEGGASAVAKEFGLELPQLEQIASDAVAVVPTVRSGWKTTEFWMAVGVMALNVVSLLKTGHVLPLDANASLGGMAAAYAGSRAYTKANAPVATTSSVQSTETKTTNSTPAVQIQAAKQ